MLVGPACPVRASGTAAKGEQTWSKRAGSFRWVGDSEAIEFRVLGPLELRADGRSLPLGSPKQRALLALLVLHANEPVSRDRLIDELWGDAAPATVNSAFHVYLSRLRKLLGERLARDVDGYTLRVDPDRFDARRFELLAGEGREALAEGNVPLAAERLREALALWHGPPLSGLSEPFASAAAGRLEEERLSALEDRIEADLELGRHGLLVAELESLVAEHPYRERLRAQLMLALYRAGRQAEALEAFTAARNRLVEELAIEPGPELRDMQRRILAQDPELGPAPRAPRLAASGSAAARPAAEREGLQPFVGRARELEELQEALGRAAAGHGSLLLISGEPGIGKSRLIATAAEDATVRGWQVLVGRCWEGGGAPAYWPWIEVLREAGGDFSQIALLGGGADGDASRVEAGDPDTARFQLFDRVGRYLAGIAAVEPCLVVLEDLHVADEPSLLLLRFVASSAERHPLLLVGSYRDGDRHVRERADLFGSLTRLGRRIPLRGLSTEEVGSYLTLASGGTSSEALAARVGEVTGGNPFFIGEIVRELATENRFAMGGTEGSLPLPAEVRALIRRRVGQLSPNALNLLRVASVIGRNFDLSVISAAANLGPERVIDLLAEAERAGTIVGAPDCAAPYSFPHDLLRETLYDDLPAGRRLELHRTIAELLQDRVGELEPHLAEIAHHFVAAAPLGDPEPAIEFSLRAGDQAREVLAYEDAARLYETALSLLGPAAASTDRSVEISLKLGDALSRSGNAEDAHRSFERAATIARSMGDAESFARAAAGHATAALRWSPVGHSGAPGFVVSPAGTAIAPLLEEALAQLLEEDSPLRARSLALLAIALYPTERDRRRLSLSQSALDMARRLRDPPVLLDALRARDWALFAPETLQSRLENAQQMLLAAAAADNDEFAYHARHARVHCFLELGDRASIDAEVQAMSELAERIRVSMYAWRVATLRALPPLIEGRLAEAEQQLRNAYEAFGPGENAFVDYMFEHAELLAVRWAQGRVEEVLGRIREQAVQFPAVPRWRNAIAAVETGDEHAARQEVERHARDDFWLAGWPGLRILHACTLAEACVLIRDATRAGTLYELLAPYADRTATPYPTLPFGPVAMRLGMLAGLLERWTDAEAHFERALLLCDSMGARAIRARVLIEQARTLRAPEAPAAQGRTDSLLSEARQLCAELELPGLAARAAAAPGHG